MYHCSICGTDSEIVNGCGCDPNNLPTVATVVLLMTLDEISGGWDGNMPIGNVEGWVKALTGEDVNDMPRRIKDHPLMNRCILLPKHGRCYVRNVLFCPDRGRILFDVETEDGDSIGRSDAASLHAIWSGAE